MNAKLRAHLLERTLRVIEKVGGRTIHAPNGDISCTGAWCAEQAKRTLEEAGKEADEDVDRQEG